MHGVYLPVSFCSSPPCRAGTVPLAWHAFTHEIASLQASKWPALAPVQNEMRSVLRLQQGREAGEMPALREHQCLLPTVVGIKSDPAQI